MPSQLTLSYIDFSGEVSSMSGFIPTVTDTNFAATATLINNLVAAIDEIVLGNLNKRVTSIVTLGSALLPTDAEAQREEKWVIHYRDTTANLAAGVTNPLFGKQYHTSLGTAMLTGHMAGNTDDAALTGDFATFVTAFEALARSPSGGAADITKIVFRGRNI